MVVNTCPVCQHAELTSIENELRAGQPPPAVARRYGLNYAFLARHWEMHSLRESDPHRVIEPLSAAEALDRMLLLLTSPWRIGPGALRLMERRGRIPEQPPAAAGIDQNPDWVRLRAKVLLTLEQFPDAYDALLKALEE
jgi:hypothetical protein